MPAWLKMMYRDFKEIKEKNLEIKRVICAVHTTGEEDYMRVGKPVVMAYTVSQRLEDILKIAYVNRGGIILPDWDTTNPANGIYIERIPLPTDESKIDWDIGTYFTRLVDCNVPRAIRQEFGINILPYYKKSSEEDDLIPIREKCWGNMPHKDFIGR